MANSITWLSHAFFKVETSEGKLIFIDPWITGNPLCPIKLADITRADLVLVTHDHFDHASDAADISKKTGAVVVGCPETVGKLKAGRALPEGQVVFGGFGMNIGGTAQVGGISVTMTQALHSSETGVSTGYIVRLEDGTTIYHAGDTGIFEGMRLFGELYGIDIALLPIGSCFTMDPFQAAHAVKIIGPKKVIPMHYMTFPILEQDASRFVSLVKEKAPEVEVIVLNPGEKHTWGR
ncbi:MAG: metal-dependent hydrolase [Syntrophobacterales bacterium]|nr:metal-dependent hydrolase [Syntrophobacterales bacterium]